MDRFAPKFKVMFAEMGNGPEGKDDWSPKTLEELFAPLVKIISMMSWTKAFMQDWKLFGGRC